MHVSSKITEIENTDEQTDQELGTTLVQDFKNITFDFDRMNTVSELRERDLSPMAQHRMMLDKDQETVMLAYRDLITNIVDPDMNVIALTAYQGSLPNGTEDIPWFDKCDKSADPTDPYDPLMDKCFEEHAEAKSPTGIVDVYLETLQEPTVLVLSAYDPIKWQIDTDSFDNIAAIFVEGNTQNIVTSQPVKTYPLKQLRLYSNDFDNHNDVLATMFNTSNVKYLYEYTAYRFEVLNDLIEHQVSIQDKMKQNSYADQLNAMYYDWRKQGERMQANFNDYSEREIQAWRDDGYDIIDSITENQYNALFVDEWETYETIGDVWDTLTITQALDFLTIDELLKLRPLEDVPVKLAPLDKSNPKGLQQGVLIFE